MFGRKAVVGVCLACTLLVSGLAAQSAMAVEGTTVFTCKEVAVPGPDGTEGFKDAHCKEATKNVSPNLSNVKFEHKEVPAGTTTELTVSNETTNGETSVAVLNSTQAGVAEEITATVVKPGAGTPWIKNLTTGKEHYIEGEGKLLYEGVSITKPAGKGCAVAGGKVETKQLKAHSMEQGMAIKFEPAAGTTIAEFEIGGCSVGALNGLYTLTGSFKATPEGATLSTTRRQV